jgi:TnpA family transposase
VGRASNKSVSSEFAFGNKLPCLVNVSLPRRTLCLIGLPRRKSELIRLYTFSEQDLSVIKQRRGDANRLGFAVLLCALRYPGQALSASEQPPNSFLTMVARQLGIDEKVWDEYGEREETRREHLSKLRAFLGLTPFGLRQFHEFARWLAKLQCRPTKVSSW